MDIDSIETSQFLIDFNPLIHKTLQRLAITKTHMDYEDYFQELQIHLLKIRKTYKVNQRETDEESVRFMFTAYAKKGLYWHGINMIKKNKKAVFHCIEDEDLEWLSHSQPSSSLHTKSNVYLEDFFVQAKKRLSDEDYLLLLYLSDEQYTIKEIAKLMKVSLSVIYDRKEKIQGRLEGIKNCLKD